MLCVALGLAVLGLAVYTLRSVIPEWWCIHFEQPAEHSFEFKARIPGENLPLRASASVCGMPLEKLVTIWSDDFTPPETN